MRSRRYTSIIEFWQTTLVEDGYGGNTVDDELITKSWANIKSVSNNSRYVTRLTELGITDPTTAIIITLRHRNDIEYNAINQYIKYKNTKYIIQNAPNNVDLFDSEVQIIAIKEATGSVENISPI